MKNTISKLLCLTLSFQLAFGTLRLSQAVAQDKAKASSVTSPAAYLKAVQEEGEALFGDNGPAFVDEQTGKIYIKHNSTTSAAIQGDEKEANSLNTLKRIEAYVPRAKKAQEMYAQFNESQKQQYKNENCTSGNCGSSKFLDPNKFQDDQIPADGLCSKNEKKKLAELHKSPKCGFGNLDASCVSDIVVSLVKSLGSMAKSVWDVGVAGKNWARSKLFDSYKPVEKSASDTGLLMSGMSAKDRELAKKNPEAFNHSVKQKIGNALSWFGEWIMNLDVPMYKELMGCAKCGERMSALCKVIGVVGKDIIKNLIILYIGGKVVQGIAKYGAKISSAGGKLMMNTVGKTAVGRAAIAWSSSRMASLGAKSAAGFGAFMETRAGKASAWLAKGGMRIVNVGDDIALGIAKKVKGAIPGKIKIGGGKAVANEIAAQTKRAEIFAKTPGLDEAAKGEVKGLSTLSDAAETSNTLKVEVPRPMTKEMEKAKKAVDRLTSTGKKASSSEGKFVDDIENATRSKIDGVNSQSIKVKTVSGDQYVNVNHPEIKYDPTHPEKLSIYTFGERGEKALLRSGDNVFIVQEGKIVNKIPQNERKTVEALLGKEEAKSNQLAVKEAKENVKASGNKVDEVNASSKDDGFTTETSKECGQKKIQIGPDDVSKAL